MGRARQLPGRDRARDTARRAAEHTSRDQWFRIVQDRTRATTGEPTYAEVYIYDEIGYWGRTAQDLVDEIRELEADEIDLHLNSPGGEIFDGIAIYQALRDHPAAINVYVDALAASIASVIAMAGDRIVMGRMAQMMIHDGFGLCIGNAADMRAMADELDRWSDVIAGAYAERAGGTVAQWREYMLAETWYGPQEAVDAGLADEVAPKSDRQSDEPAARHDLSQFPFRFAGRKAAPSPAGPAGGGRASGSGAGSGTPGTAPPADAQGEPGPAGGTDEDVVDALAAGADTATIAPIDPAEFRAAIEAATGDDLIWDDQLAASFRAVMQHEANHRPATPTVAVTPPPADPRIDPVEFATALKEALQ